MFEICVFSKKGPQEVDWDIRGTVLVLPENR